MGISVTPSTLNTFNHWKIKPLSWLKRLCCGVVGVVVGSMDALCRQRLLACSDRSPYTISSGQSHWLFSKAVMKLVIKKRAVKRILWGTLVVALLLFAVVFIIIPVIYRSSYALQKRLLFLNFVSLPVDFKNPSVGTRNFYINGHNNVTLGVWHTLPVSLFLRNVIGEGHESLLGIGKPIFLYFHGNSGNRGADHRVKLYEKLSILDFHVISFDYRSFGDSSQHELSEKGVVEDGKTVYRWVKERAKKSKIYFWGHSLGTGISSHVLDDLEAEGEPVGGLVLESPFNNMKDEVRSYPLARIFTYLPWFDYFFIDPMMENGLEFKSDYHLSKVKAPILILHAEDDLIVPFALGKKLFDTLKEKRQGVSLLCFKGYDKSKKFGHKFIYKDEELTDIVSDFINKRVSHLESSSVICIQ